MIRILKRLSQAIQVVLLAPITLPGKAMNVLKYIAVGLGIIEKVIEEDPPEVPSQVDRKEEEDANVD